MNQLIDPCKKRYQAILFDLDGTLTDPGKGISRSIQFALKKMGRVVPSAQELASYIGEPLKDVFSTLLKSSCENLLKNAVEYYRERYAVAGVYENVLYNGVELMLQKLCQQNYRLFVATSKPEIFAVEILRYFGLSHYFEKIYGSALDGSLSYKDELLHYILQNSRIEKPSLMVGDRKFDMAAAIHHDLVALGVLYGYGSEEELYESGAYHLCRTPNEVYEWINL